MAEQDINIRLNIDESSAAASFENVAQNLQQIESSAESTGGSINSAFNSQKVTQYGVATNNAANANMRLDATTRKTTMSQSRQVRATNAASGALLRFSGVSSQAASGTRALSGALATTPFGSVLAGVTALYTAYSLLTSFMGENTEAAEDNAKSLEEVRNEHERLTLSAKEMQGENMAMRAEYLKFTGELTEQEAKQLKARARTLQMEAALSRKFEASQKWREAYNAQTDDKRIGKTQKEILELENALNEAEIKRFEANRAVTKLQMTIAKDQKEAADAAKKQSEDAAKRREKEAARRQKLEESIEKFKTKILEAEMQARLELIVDEQVKAVEVREDATRKQLLSIEELFEKQKEAIEDLGLTEEQENDRLSKLKERKTALILQIEKDEKQDIAKIKKDFDTQEAAEEKEKTRQAAEELLQRKENELEIAREKFQQKQILQRDEFLAVTRTEKEIEEFEKQQQAERLKAEKEFQIAIIQAQLDAGIQQTELQRKLLKERITTLKDEIEQEVADVAAEGNEGGGSSFLAELLGVSDEAVSNVLGSLEKSGKKILGTLSRQAAERKRIADERKNAAEQEIDFLQRRIDTELKLVESGRSANLGLLRQEIAEQEKLRQKAIEDKRKAAKAQFAIDTALQAANLVTSGTEVFKTLSPGFPATLPIAIGTVAAMIQSFVASRAQAAKAVGTMALAEGGEIPIGRDDRRKDTDGYRIGDTNMYVGGGEYVMPLDKTKKYRRLLDAMRSGDLDFTEINSSLANNLTDTRTKVAEHKKEETKRLYKEAVKDAINEQTASLGSKLDMLVRKPDRIAKNNGDVVEYYYNKHGMLVEKRTISQK